MKILKNKYFILGNIALLLAAIPLTLLFLSRQQDIRSQAAPTTRITLTPTTLSFEDDQCTEKTITARLDPGENIVATVELFLTYDSTKFNITITPNENVFPEILRGPTVSTGQASVVMNIGSSVTNAIQVPVDIATITVSPLASTEEAATISIDSSKTRVFSLSENDGDTENVFLSGGQAAISIDASCVNEEPEEPEEEEEPVDIDPQEEATPSATPSPSPTLGQNQSPICSTLTVNPSNSGAAPLALSFSAQGSDPDGQITKATFDFGDSMTQDVFEGMGNSTVSAQLAHTYQSAGNFTASVIFTDNSGAISSACTTQVNVTTPAQQETIQPTATATPTPTIENPGGVGTTIAVIGGLLLVILGGLALIAL